MAEGDAWLLITDLLTFFVVRLFNVEPYIHTVNMRSNTRRAAHNIVTAAEARVDVFWF